MNTSQNTVDESVPQRRARERARHDFLPVRARNIYDAPDLLGIVGLWVYTTCFGLEDFLAKLLISLAKDRRAVKKEVGTTGLLF